MATLHDRFRLVDWLLGDARLSGDMPALLEAFCRRLATQGLPVWRCSLGIRMLHPEIRMLNLFWRRDRETVEVVGRKHGTETSPEYLASPVAAVIDNGAEALRFRLERMEAPRPFPILDELAEQGATDYAIMALGFSNGRRNMISFASDRPGGFATEDLALINGVLPAFAMVVEALAVRLLAVIMLDTYVGRRTGTRILSGDIRRGTGEEVRAVLWDCDLRGFTSLADRLPREELIALLNGYFEVMAGAVEAHDGEILKFIGDAMLAIFPPDASLPAGDEADREAADRALTAAEEALAGMDRLNAERAAWGAPTLRCGIALHIGDVMYGNIGAPTRLDFTVIGPAVNLVSRLEGLCPRLDRDVLTSSAFAGALGGDRLASLGWQPIRGLADPVEVFGLKEPKPQPQPFR